MRIRYIVSSRGDWDDELQARFGDLYSVHELDDTEIVELLVAGHRLEIRIDPRHRMLDAAELEFQDEYD